MKGETLREAWHLLDTEGLRSDDLATFFHQYGDAHIYRGTCKTCGGSEWVEVVVSPGGCDPVAGDEGDPSEREQVPCPDCKDTPVSVVTKELREKAGQKFWELTRYLRVDKLNDVQWEDLSPVRKLELMEEADAILTTVLPNVRHAKGIVNVKDDWGLKELAKLHHQMTAMGVKTPDLAILEED